MPYEILRETMTHYYMNDCRKLPRQFAERVFARLDRFDADHPSLSPYQLKSAQYDTIADEMQPVLFPGVPFYFEAGILDPFGDGQMYRAFESFLHANGWLWQRNDHIFGDNDPHGNDLFIRNQNEKLYFTNIDNEHFPLPLGKIFEKGLSGVYAECMEALGNSKTDEEKQFVECAVSGLRAIHKMSDKFAAEAEKRIASETDPEEIQNLKLIADTAARIPWEKPVTFYEGLCTMAFMRKALGAIEGVGYNTFGLADRLLLPGYERSKSDGMTDEQLYDLVCKFMLIWDCHVDKSLLMSGYCEYEYENTLTLGGFDSNGSEVFNRITEMFIKAQLELDSIYPKLMCRYGAGSSDAYLSLINTPTINGKSILLYQNDDVMLPAIMRDGRTREEACEYVISGCWGSSLPDLSKRSSGEYVNILKVLEWTVHMPEDKLRSAELDFKPLSDAGSFDDVYRIVLDNILLLINQKAEIKAKSGRLWSKVNPVCATSALFRDCLINRRDYTAGGSGVAWETFALAGFPDVIDSLLVIKKLCFEDKVCTLNELITACKLDWQDEVLRARALRCPSFGDGSEESSLLAARLHDDIYANTRSLPTAYGGQYQMAYYMYTEIIWWGKLTLATPNGRHAGDYLSHGLTPSRLRKINSATDVMSSLRYMDMTKVANNAIMNVVLPALKMTLPLLNAFLRGCAAAGSQALQINCVSRELLLEAQRDPEHHRDIIVRVCGFSAPFVMLSDEFQAEFLSRNFYGEF